MIKVDMMRSSDGSISLPGWKVRAVAEELVGPICRQTWSTWCRGLKQCGRKTSWIEIEIASQLLARAYLASNGVRWYSGKCYEVALFESREYWENYVGDLK